MSNKYLIVMILLLAICLGAGVFCVWRSGQIAQPGENEPGVENLGLSDAEMENLAKQIVREYWENHGENVEYWENLGHSIQLVELNEPLVEELIATHKIYKSHRSWISPTSFCIVAVGHYDGHTFILPDEFNNVVLREEISVNENTALNLSKVYVTLWANNSPTYADITFLENATDISWSENAMGENPGKYENVVKPPQLTPTSDGGFQVRLYTWMRVLGVLSEWSFVVNGDGQLSAQTMEVAGMVGDYTFPPI